MYGDMMQPLETKCVDVPRQTLTERLVQERNNVANRLAELDGVISALNANPAIQSVLDLLQKTRCL